MFQLMVLVYRLSRQCFHKADWYNKKSLFTIIDSILFCEDLISHMFCVLATRV